MPQPRESPLVQIHDKLTSVLLFFGDKPLIAIRKLKGLIQLDNSLLSRSLTLYHNMMGLNPIALRKAKIVYSVGLSIKFWPF